MSLGGSSKGLEEDNPLSLSSSYIYIYIIFYHIIFVSLHFLGFLSLFFFTISFFFLFFWQGRANIIHSFFNDLWFVWNLVVRLSLPPTLGLLCKSQVRSVGISSSMCSIAKGHHAFKLM
jgi:hypothetical protein